MATLIKADGTISFIKPKGKRWQAPELHELVGGYFQMLIIQPGEYGILSVAPGTILWCNEDGKRLGLPVNRTATTILHKSGGIPNDVVVGDVVLTNPSEVD